MAILTVDGQSKELPDGEQIRDTAEDLGVPFGCKEGQCATCIIIVEEGHENLAPKNNAEEAMGLGDDERLACQAVIKHGEVKATW